VFAKFVLRDAVLSTVVGGAWILAWPVSTGTGPVADLVGVVLGLGAGLVAYLGHEWGHLTGALLTGSHVTAPAKLSSGFLFSFDSRRNSRRQFVLMSLSGFAVTGIALVVVYGFLPQEALATRVARGLVVFGASLTVFVETPLLLVSLLSGSILPQVEVFPASETGPPQI
jgi:hypothetical protein